MQYLLDTHILLWVVQNHPRLNDTVKDIIIDQNNAIFFSVASIWEVAIKYKNGGDILEPNLFYQTLLKNKFAQLNINANHTLLIKDLPLIHKDPFDRILIAQAKIENLILMTVDDKIRQYDGVPILMV